MPTSKNMIMILDVGIFGIVSKPKFWDCWFKLKDKINHHSVD